MKNMNRVLVNIRPVLTLYRNSTGKNLAKVELAYYTLGQLHTQKILGDFIDHDRNHFGDFLYYDIADENAEGFGDIKFTRIKKMLEDPDVEGQIELQLFGDPDRYYQYRCVLNEEPFITPGSVIVLAKDNPNAIVFEKDIPRLNVDRAMLYGAIGSFVDAQEDGKLLIYNLRDTHRKGLLGINQREFKKLREEHDIYISFRMD